MNRTVKASLASILAFSMFAGGASAASNGNSPDPLVRQKIDQNTTGSVKTEALMRSDMVAAWQAGKINVVAISTLNDVDPNKSLLRNQPKTHPDDVAALQTAIQNNSALKSQLQARNVQLRNIVAAVLSADGAVTFYVK
jgi:hypothetical protein